MMHKGYAIEKFLDRYESKGNDYWFSSLTVDGLKKMIDRHEISRLYAAYKKTGNESDYRAYRKAAADFDEAWSR